MQFLTFVTTLAASLFLLAGVAWSLAYPDRRFWPPADRDWRYWLHWSVDAVARVGLLAVAVLNRNTLGLPRPSTFFIGGILLIIGSAVAIAVERDLGTEATMGLEGALVTDGLYRYSRNPQYVGFLTATLGLLLLADSRLLIPIICVQILHWLALPLAEEPWLAAQYGAAYEQYRAGVPRFFGRETVSRALTDTRAAIRELLGS